MAYAICTHYICPPLVIVCQADAVTTEESLGAVPPKALELPSLSLKKFETEEAAQAALDEILNYYFHNEDELLSQPSSWVIIPVEGD